MARKLSRGKRNGKALKRYISRSIETSLKAEHKERIAKLRARAKLEKTERKENLREAKRACDRRVKGAVASADKAFREARAAALALQKAATTKRHSARKARKQAAREKCALDREHIKAESAAKRRLTAAERKAEHKERREYEAGERAIAGRERRIVRSTAKERREESDDLVRSNIEPHLYGLWKRRKRYTKGSARRSRTEEFLEWVAENPEELALSQIEAVPTDVQFAEQERAAFAERQGAVPF